MLGRWALVTLVLAGALCAGGCSGGEDPEEISVLDIRATAGTDGVVRVTKLVTYRSRGSDRTTLHDWIPLRANIGFLRNRYRTVRNVRVTTTEETPLPARISRKPDGVDVAVPVARTGVRTFAISYELRNAFTVTDDAITFDHDLVGSDWRVRTHRTAIRLHMPGLVGAACTVTAPADSTSRPCDAVQVSERGQPDAAVVVRQDTPRTDQLRLELRLREGAVIAEPPVPGPPFWADRPVMAGLLAAGPIAAALLIAGLVLDHRGNNRGRLRPSGPGGPPSGGGSAPPRGVRPGRSGYLAARALVYVLAGSVLGSFGLLGWSIWTYLQLPMEQAAPFAAPLAGLLMTLFGLVFGLGLREEIEVWRPGRRARRT